jgi:anaerobic ribonucleoside-triphosphate reductase activating protein
MQSRTNAEARSTCVPHAAPAPLRAAGLRVGGLTPFTNIDYPGKLAAVVFVQGCPLRCPYCHNPHLQPRQAPAAHAWPDLRDWLRTRRGLLDAVVFSGGEPTMDPCLWQAMEEVRHLGFAVGLHTAGTYPRRLQQVLPLVDWIGLDVKAPLARPGLHDAIAGVDGTSTLVERSLSLALAAEAELECRTTADPAILSDADLLQIGLDLHARGVRRHAIQIARPVYERGSPPASGMAPAGYPSAETLRSLRDMFPSFVLRRE